MAHYVHYDYCITCTAGPEALEASKYLQELGYNWRDGTPLAVKANDGTRLTLIGKTSDVKRITWLYSSALSPYMNTNRKPFDRTRHLTYTDITRNPIMFPKKPVSKEPAVLTSRKPNDQRWSFKSLHDADVDWEDINKSLSPSNPIALISAVTRKNGDRNIYQRLVMVHSSLMMKASLIDMPPPEGGLPNISKPDYSARGILQVIGNDGDFCAWVDWATSVRSAEWPEEGRRKVTFHVHTPAILPE